jgi:hypothetical protein
MGLGRMIVSKTGDSRGAHCEPLASRTKRWFLELSCNR